MQRLRLRSPPAMASKRLIGVARNMAVGAFLFLQPVAAVHLAPELLGLEKKLHVAVRCLLDPGLDSARALARRACAFYLSLPPYHARYGDLGYEPAD